MTLWEQLITPQEVGIINRAIWFATESFCFMSLYMEIRLSAVAEKPVCADLSLLFSFGLIHKENSWQLHSGYRQPWQWTACMMLSGKLWLVGKAWCLLYQCLKSRVCENVFHDMLIVSCSGFSVSQAGLQSLTWTLKRSFENVLMQLCSRSSVLKGI